MYVPLCEPWPLPPSGCPIGVDGASPAATGAAWQAASEQLWELTGRQYGNCSVLLRPCRRSCAPGWWPGSMWWGGWGPGWGSWPQWPDMASEAWWLDAACGSCGRGACGCNDADTLVLPAKAQRVTQVLIDGAELAEGTGWNLFNGDLLVRADGQRWPLCQDWTVPVSGVGAWSVTAVFGQPVPAYAQNAVAQLTTEFAKFCITGKCSLPRNVTSNTRQGTAQEFPSMKDLRESQSTGLWWVDNLLNTSNPDRLRGHARIWNPDDYAAGRGPRQPGGWA